MNNVKWEFTDGEVDMNLINSVEEKLGFVFPMDYKECVKVNQGGNPVADLFDVSGIERVFGTLLKINQPDSPSDIVNKYQNLKKMLPKKIIPIANDPAGNLICFDYKGHEESPVVVFWEHEGAWEKEMLMEEEGLSEEQAEQKARENVFFVADTFTDFLNSLYEDDEDDF
ncbi:SMI1/KNR4 family protein [Bacillus sp. RAR_GA_16]|uniref:SMI1/KNR4 family protein n=1 Tax=Bacillus sp. RAR_GA_16 TaxID=2876774 RepID=UPI001CCEAEC2|nr:SMI1/KNR4 family protein [Bacillus sp. RAR_GA_16]MCA0174662.1 SMI1/KNR4 family protein [Bacillus sp. RAR_GA_16]